jgi:hypothetical protein
MPKITISNAGEDMEQLRFPSTSGKIPIATSALENSLQSFIKLNIPLPYNLLTSLLDIYERARKIYIYKET